MILFFGAILTPPVGCFYGVRTSDISSEDYSEIAKCSKKHPNMRSIINRYLKDDKISGFEYGKIMAGCKQMDKDKIKEAIGKEGYYEN